MLGVGICVMLEFIPFVSASDMCPAPVCVRSCSDSLLLSGMCYSQVCCESRQQGLSVVPWQVLLPAPVVM